MSTKTTVSENTFIGTAEIRDAGLAETFPDLTFSQSCQCNTGSIVLRVENKVVDNAFVYTQSQSVLCAECRTPYNVSQNWQTARY